jgi:hypothetical protein
MPLPSRTISRCRCSRCLCHGAENGPIGGPESSLGFCPSTVPRQPWWASARICARNRDSPPRPCFPC